MQTGEKTEKAFGLPQMSASDFQCVAALYGEIRVEPEVVDVSFYFLENLLFRKSYSKFAPPTSDYSGRASA